MNNNVGGYNYILVYGILIALIALLIKTRVGYVFIYYFVALSLAVLLLTNSQRIADIFGAVPIGAQQT